MHVSSAGGMQLSPSSQFHGTPARHCRGVEGEVGEGERQRREKWGKERDREGRSGGGGRRWGKGERQGEGEGRRTGREETKGEGEEEGKEVKQPKWLRVPTSFWMQADDTYSKHHLSIFVFLNWKADSNISSVGCGGERVGKEATETSCPDISQTWSASSIRESSMPL